MMLKTGECLEAHEGAICRGYKKCTGCGVTHSIQKPHKCHHTSCFRCHVMYPKDARHLCYMQAPRPKRGGAKRRKVEAAPQTPPPGAGGDLGVRGTPSGTARRPTTRPRLATTTTTTPPDP
jgi:hypothetical protein